MTKTAKAAAVPEAKAGAGHPGEKGKEKVVEKRKALGRGLSALLPPLQRGGAVEPGPRVVTAADRVPPKQSLGGAPAEEQDRPLSGAPAGTLVALQAPAAGRREEQIPSFGRNDKAGGGRDDRADEGVGVQAPSAAPPQLAKIGRAGDPGALGISARGSDAAQSPQLRLRDGIASAGAVAPLRMTEGRIAELRAEGEDGAEGPRPADARALNPPKQSLGGAPSADLVSGAVHTGVTGSMLGAEGQDPLKPKAGVLGTPELSGAPAPIVVGAQEPFPPKPTSGLGGASVDVASGAAGLQEQGAVAELRSAGQSTTPYGENRAVWGPRPGAAVPTLDRADGEHGRAGTPVAPQTYPAMGTHIRGHVRVPAAEVEEDARRAAALGEGAAVTVRAGDEVIRLEIHLIDDNPHQTRMLFDREALEEMAQSIRVQGVLQPVVVRPSGDGRYKLILGDRRLRASKMAGIETVPAFVKRVNDQQAAEMTLVENLQRQDLNCLEQASAFQNLSQNFKLTQEEIGKRVGMSREAVANYMRLLTLPSGVLEALVGERLTYSHARALMPLRDEVQIWTLAQRAMEENLTVSDLENIVNGIQVRRTNRQAPKGRLGARWLDPNVKAAQRSLEEVLGMRVRISDRRGRGKIVIQYESLEDFDRVVGMLRGKG